MVRSIEVACSDWNVDIVKREEMEKRRCEAIFSSTTVIDASL
jgi:hypothetical protein